jgi:hypothetical protein
MTDTESSIRALRVTSDSMYDPANPRESFVAGDKVIVDPAQEAEEGNFVIVSFEGSESLMMLTLQGGARVYKYLAPDLGDVCLTDADAFITGVVTERHRPYVTSMTGPLKWLGDDIGLCNDAPILVNLADRHGHARMVFLREALMAADLIDEYGKQRITSALSFAAEHGYLRPMDLGVWNEFKSDRMVGGQMGGDIYNVAKNGGPEVQLAASRGV